MTTGDKLVKLRGDRRPEIVCAACGISNAALCMYEKDKRVPRDEIKVKLARYYGTTVGALFFNEQVHNM